MSSSKLQQLSALGQSVWLDYISRPLLETGRLKEWIEQGLRGMTSNPAIFNQAIGSSNDYDAKIIKLKNEGKSTFEIYDALTIEDIQEACDQFKHVYETTKGLDGYVSLEINPLLAHKVREQIAEGKRLHKAVNRDNLMVKVPSTREGFSVLEELIASGINVNTTLIFSLEQYIDTTEAYLRGLHRLSQTDQDLSRVHSVASVFVSRIDAAVDQLIDDKLSQADTQQRQILESLKGQAAVANCRIVYEKFKEVFASEEFQKLFDQGANVQRVLWASTSTKNPAYSDVKYVSELMTKPTVNTIPSKTLDIFIEKGDVKEAFTDNADKYFQIIQSLKNFGIDINDVCSMLLVDGCQAFDKSFEELLASVEKKAELLTIK